MLEELEQRSGPADRARANAIAADAGPASAPGRRASPPCVTGRAARAGEPSRAEQLLADVDPEQLSPREALDLLFELKGGGGGRK